MLGNQYLLGFTISFGVKDVFDAIQHIFVAIGIMGGISKMHCGEAYMYLKISLEWGKNLQDLISTPIVSFSNRGPNPPDLNVEGGVGRRTLNQGLHRYRSGLFGKRSGP